MEKRSIYGLTKGTGLEKLIEAAAMGKAMGVMNHYSLALMAEERGLPKELAERLRELANQESVHAGYYATLNAKYPSDVFQMMENMQKGELGAGKFLQPLADKLRELGRDDVAEQIEEYIRQEVHHGEVLGELLAKYKQ